MALDDSPLRRRTGSCKARLRTAVVPTTSEQSATASATESNSCALLSSAEAPTAERASRKATAYELTRRRSRGPKLLMARAAAPMLSGLRGRTNTTTSWSSSEILPGKPPFYDKTFRGGVLLKKKRPESGAVHSELTQASIGRTISDASYPSCSSHQSQKKRAWRVPEQTRWSYPRQKSRLSR